MTFGDLRDALDELAGLDLDEDKRDELLNEGYREMCARAEFLRGQVELGPGVADDDSYLVPSNVYRILNVEVAGYRYSPSSRDDFNRLTAGNTYLLADGLWYRDYSSTGVESVRIYPVPAGDETINALCILRPDELVDATDEPLVPPEFHRALTDYAAAIAFASVEDNVDLRSYYQQEFDRKVGELRRLTFSTGRQTTFMAPLGRTYS